MRNAGSSKRFFKRSSRSSWSRIRVASFDTSASGSMPWRRMIDTGMPCVSSKMAEKRSSGLDGVAAAAARVQQRELEEQLRRWRDADVATRRGRQHSKMFFERLKDLVGVQIQIVHHLPEGVPLDLGECQAQVLVGEQRVFAPAGVFERTIHDALGRLSQFVLRDVEVLHDNLQRILHGREQDGGQPSCGRRTQPIPVNCLTPNGNERIPRQAGCQRGRGWWRVRGARSPRVDSGFLPRGTRGGP